LCTSTSAAEEENSVLCCAVLVLQAHIKLSFMWSESKKPAPALIFPKELKVQMQNI
jgi:hypothetical protein